MEAQAQTQKHWMAYWWPGIAILGGGFGIAILLGWASNVDRRAAASVRPNLPPSLAAALGSIDPGAPPDRIRARDEIISSEYGHQIVSDAEHRRIAALIRDVDVAFEEPPARIARLTTNSQVLLSNEGVEVSCIDIMEHALRRSASGASYQLVCADFVTARRLGLSKP